MGGVSAQADLLPLGGPDALPDAVFRYAEHADGLLDVHLPPQPSRPTRVVVLLHGGFWKTAYDRKHTRPVARALADAGLVVATPEYRRVGPGGTGGWPRTGTDVRRAVDELPGLLAGIGVEVDELQVLGHSAGGHLALWLATTGLPIARTVALAPVGDLREAIRLGLGSDATVAFLGDRDRDNALAEADPRLLLAERPQGAVHVIHGTDDADVPVSLSRGLVEQHGWIRLTELPVGHFEVIDPGHDAFATVLRSLLSPVT